MNEVGPADRDRLLRSKRQELSGIVTSRKRKLRELFAVCDNEFPIPQIDLSNPDAPTINHTEAKFLEVTDILQDRLFHESNLPTRRQTRSTTSKQRSPIRKTTPEARANDPSRKTSKQRDASKPRKSRAPTPSARNDGGRAPPTPHSNLIPNGTSTISVEIPPMQRSSSKSSQTDRTQPVANPVLENVVDARLNRATQSPSPQVPILEPVLPAKDLERVRIQDAVESRPNSPGVDPKKAMPVLADVAQLPGPILAGMGDPQHKAATIHLPPKEVQEHRLEVAEKAREERVEAEQLSIHLPPPEASKNAEQLVSSPGSTIDAHSATTPAMHEASTDTSPDNESSHYDVERLDDKEDEPETPPELKQTPEEAAEKAEHDRILQSRIEIARAEIMRSSPTAAENQLLEEQAAVEPSTQAEASDLQNRDDTIEVEVPPPASELTEEATEVVEDVVHDQKEVEEAQPDEDVPMADAKSTVPETTSEAKGKEPEIPDSETEQTPPVDSAMDVDRTTVKDSFESNDTIEVQPAPVPARTSPVETPPPVPEPQHRRLNPALSVEPPIIKRNPSIPSPSPVTDRMVTRVASGAMRHKSVSEILGETPRPSASTSEQSTSKGDSDSARTSNSPSGSATPLTTRPGKGQSPGPRARLLAEKAKERSKLSTVVFAKQPPAKVNLAEGVNGGPQPPQSSKDDYFMPLFLATASNEKRGCPSIDALLASARKTITTENAYVPINENQTAKVLKRIYNLQSSNKWSLRQPKRSPEPIRPTSHWDLLIQEAKWMRTDFREEKKWKMTLARNMAEDCAEWVAASPEDRKLLQVNATIPPKHDGRPQSSGGGSSHAASHPTPELVASGADSPSDDFEDEPRLDMMESPTNIFALSNEEVVFGLKHSAAAQKLLDELPMYGAPLKVPSTDPSKPGLDPDRYWKRPALALSKYVEGRMELKMEEPPRKKSRFQYETEDDDDDQVVFEQAPKQRVIVPPEMTDVALFNPENKHIRDRIHSSHQFRPPSEFPMPAQSFFEHRIASQWTWDEDNELKNLVREYSYNWSLISSFLQSKSIYSSGAERRTPWECFERWIHMEGLPVDMQKTQYFRAYTARIDTANRIVMSQNIPVPQPNAQGQMVPQPRRRTTQSVRVERRRAQKHIMLVDAMRKLAKKRETNIAKQNHTSNMAALRKANETPQVRQLPANTPQDFSRMKHERDEQMKERIALFQQRQENQRRAAMQRTAGANQQPGPQGRVLPPNGAMGANTSSPGNQNLAVPGQNRPRPMPPQMNGQQISNRLQVPQMSMTGVPQAPMQGQLPLPNPTLDIGLVNRAQQVQQHQNLIRQQQQQQQGQLNGQSPQMHNSPPRVNGLPQPGFPMQGSMMAPFNPNGNSVSTPPSNSFAPSPGQAGSPRMGQLPPNQMAPNMNHVQMLEQQIRRQNPNATSEQIMQVIQKQLPNFIQSRQGHSGMTAAGMNPGMIATSAMNAAAGNHMTGMNINGNLNGMSAGQGTPQLYAQMLRQQQEKQLVAQQQANAVGQQQAQQNGANGNGMNGANGNGNANSQGHTHRASSGSVQSSK